jgi:hypothetical protein
MFKYPHIPVILARLQLTWTEKLLLIVATILVCASIIALMVSSINALVLVLAAAAIIALVRERLVSRQTLLVLAEHLDTVDTLNKFEIKGSSGAGVIDQALNRAIQRTREQTRQGLSDRQPTPLRMVEAPPLVDRAVPVAVLSIDLRRCEFELYTPAYTEYLAQIIDAVNLMTRQMYTLLQPQGDGTLLLIFGSQSEQAVALSLRQALDVALMLSGSYVGLRFGLTCGSAQFCSLPGVGQTIVGVPLEDALRLSRMAASWHEYSLLCTEPTALLARAFPSQRTPLQFTHAAMPALPIYALDLDPAAVAMSA